MSDTPAARVTLEVFGRTDVGLVREHNEDKFAVVDPSTGFCSSELTESKTFELGNKGGLLLVCDGMGGAAAGEVASGMAVDVIHKNVSEAAPSDRNAFAISLRRSVERANEAIFKQSRANQSERGMGTTCTAAALMDGTLMVGQIGDSRCYLFRNGELAQVTRDQSLAWQLIEAGAMTTEEAKQFEHANIILQALGVQERVEVVLSRVDLRRGDVALLCSDGLHGPVSDEEILEIMKAGGDLAATCDALIKKALEHDGPDNVTVVLARFAGEGLPEPTPADKVVYEAFDPGPDPDAPEPTGEENPVSEPLTVSESPLAMEVRRSVERAAVAEAEAVRAAAEEPLRAGLVTFVFLALLAAAAGSLFIRCDTDQEGLRAPASQPAP